MAEKPEPTPDGRRRNRREYGGGVSNDTAARENSHPETECLMEEVVERESMLSAYRRVVANKGAAGVGGMTVEQLSAELKARWQEMKGKLLEGSYRPQPVKRVEIPKPGGAGMRKLGIPTVTERLVQQALLQVLTPIFDPGFSEYSYGFRPGRSAHQAVLQAREYIADDHRWVVDIDLEKFFDTVNHDMLMARVACLKGKVKLILRRGKGWSVGRTIDTLTPLLRGWYSYFSLAETKNVLEELDSWLRRRFRLILRRQWKRPRTRVKRLMERGLDADHARKSACNGRGP